MDQMACSLGQANQIMSFCCRPPFKVLKPLRVPSDVLFYGIDSGVRHSVGGSDYTSVRIGAFMGLTIIRAYAKSRGFVKDPVCLADLTPQDYLNQFQEIVPQTMSGEEFLKLYGHHGDQITQIDPSRVYEIKIPTEHPIHENARVQEFSSLLELLGDKAASQDAMSRLGQLMFESHSSYSKCGLGSPETDLIVSLVSRYTCSKSVGPQALFGAKITGGGSGGTVCVLAKQNKSSWEAICRIRSQYASKFGFKPRIFVGSSGGSAVFGARTVQLLRQFTSKPI